MAVALLTAAPAVGQFSQYVPPGQFEEERETIQERLDRAMKESRWRVGRFFIDPWFGLRNASYLDNVQGVAGDETESDFTATVGAGLRLYRPVGSEMTFAAHALPEYVWWQDLEGRRRTNGRYGAGFFGNFGRAGLELSATRSEDAIFFSREVETPVNTRYDVGSANLEFELGAGVALFVGAETRLIRYLDQDEPFLSNLDLLDRDEEVVRGGIRFSPAGGLIVGLGVEESTVDFETSAASSAQARDRSNSGTSPILQVDFSGNVFDFTLNAASRDLEPEPGADFVAYEAVTGSARLLGKFGGRLRPQLYVNKNLVYSVQQEWAYFEDNSVGLGVRTSLGRKASLRLFIEQGTNDYIAVGTGRIDREDDLDVIGGDVRFSLGRFFLSLGATTTDYDSNRDTFDREVTVIRSGFGLARSGGGNPWG